MEQHGAGSKEAEEVQDGDEEAKEDSNEGAKRGEGRGGEGGGAHLRQEEQEETGAGILHSNW